MMDYDDGRKKRARAIPCLEPVEVPQTDTDAGDSMGSSRGSPRHLRVRADRRRIALGRVPTEPRSRQPAAAGASAPVYGYNARTFALPGFNPLAGYLSNLGGKDSQIPTLASTPGQPFGVYYVDNNSNLDIVNLANDTGRSIAHIVPLYQVYSGYDEMLDNEFYIEYGYDQALFFGTGTSGGAAYSLELVNLTSGAFEMWNTTTKTDASNQQVDYVGNDTVVVMSSNCSILAYNLASHQSWIAGRLGTDFGGGASCFEANNVYWFPEKQQLINVEADKDRGDHVEQLDATYDTLGRVYFTSVQTIAVDSGIVFNWVNGLAYSATRNEIAFSAGYWPANTVYTYVVPYGANGLLTTLGEVRYSADNSGSLTGRLLEIQRYVYEDAYMVGQPYGPSVWTNGTQCMFDPWNGSVIMSNCSIGSAPCANACFEGQYAPSPDYVIDFNATLQLNFPMWKVVYAYHNASVPPGGTPTVLWLTPNSGPNGTLVELSGGTNTPGTSYSYCWAPNPAGGLLVRPSRSLPTPPEPFPRA